MCDFLSFCVNTSVLKGEPPRVYLGDGESHAGIARGWGLKPDDYRECEWTGNEARRLRVRASNTPARTAITAAILAKFPTRADLFASLKEGRSVLSGSLHERSRFRFARGDLWATHYRHQPYYHEICHSKNGDKYARPSQFYSRRGRHWLEDCSTGAQCRRIPAGNLLARIRRHCKPLMEL